jgi:hypothetical protein
LYRLRVGFVFGAQLAADWVGSLALQVLALAGARVESSNDITGEIARAAADDDACYTLQIKPAPAKHANEYHSITVEGR